MNVCGSNRASRTSSARAVAIRPENFERHEPSSDSARRSATMNPRLCRVRAYSGPGFPSPTTRRSSVGAGLRRRRSPIGLLGGFVAGRLLAAGFLATLAGLAALALLARLGSRRRLGLGLRLGLELGLALQILLGHRRRDAGEHCALGIVGERDA